MIKNNIKKMKTKKVAMNKKRPNKDKSKPASKITMANKKVAILDALANNFRNVTEACKIANISRETFYIWCANDPKFKQDVDNVKIIVKEKVENKLWELIEKGDRQAIIFYLSRKAGYTEKQEIDMNVNDIIKFDFGDELNKEEDE